MGQVIQMFNNRNSKRRAHSTTQRLLEKDNLRKRINRHEKITRAYQNLVATSNDPRDLFVARQIADDCQHQLDCMIAEYTGLYGAYAEFAI